VACGNGNVVGINCRTMPPSLDDSSFIVVGDVFDTDDDDDDDLDVDELLSVASERENAAGGTLILPSASTRVTFTPPSSVDSDIASLDLLRQQRLLVSDDDDDMEGIDDPLGLHVGTEGGLPPNVDAHHGDVRPSKFMIPEQSPTTATATGTSWTKGIEQARILLQDRMPVIMATPHRRRSVLLLLFVYMPVLVAVLGVATYTKHLDTLRLRDLEMTSQLREKEHQERIQQLQEEIEKLKKHQQSGFTFTIPEPTWLKTTKVDVSGSATTQTLLKQWKDIKTSAYKTVDSLRTTLEKDLEEAKEWWTEKQRMVIEKLEALDTPQHASRGTSFHAPEEEDESSLPPGNTNNNGDDGDGDEQAEEEAETATDTAEHTKKGKNLMPSKKTILASAAIVTVASVLLGAAIDAMFGQSGPSRLDYETFDQTFGVPLADFVD
jgi:hypothetical protein